jgi:putative endonuclease
MSAWVYILKCSDGSYYAGLTRADLNKRVAQHQSGEFEGYTATRRPVQLVYSEHFERTVDAIASERRIKGWSRAKKKALIEGNFERLKLLARPSLPHGSRRAASRRSSP